MQINWGCIQFQIHLYSLLIGGCSQNWQEGGLRQLKIESSRMIIIQSIVACMYNEEGEVSPEIMLRTARKTKGYLFKRARNLLGSWQRRYFLIINHSLIYYPDETLEKKKGMIELSDIQQIQMRANNEFVILMHERTYEFRCETEKQMSLWVASLNLLKEVNNLSPNKQFLLRSSTQESGEQACNYSIMLPKCKKVLSAMRLDLMAKKIEELRILRRILLCENTPTNFYIAVSIKALQHPERDEYLLSEKYVQPYCFNTLYEVNVESNLVSLIAKMSSMKSFKVHQKQMIITLMNMRKLKVSIDSPGEAQNLSERLSRCHKVAKEYYNSFKIILKKNIDSMVWLYDNHCQHFEDQTRYRIATYFVKYKSEPHEPVTMFISDFHSFKRNLIEIEEACRVLAPPRNDIRSHYIRIAHEVVGEKLIEGWELLHENFQTFELIKLANEVYEFWILSSTVVSDPIYLEGCCDLNNFFLRKSGENIKCEIEKIHYSRIEVKRVSDELLSNELTSVFNEWLVEMGRSLGDFTAIQKTFGQLCKFFVKSFDEYSEYLTEISEKWTQNLVLIGACNDINKTRKLLSIVGSQICQGIIPQSKFYHSCAVPAAKKLSDVLASLIKRIFLIVFSSIDKKILSRPFCELNIGKICYEVLQKLQPFKNQVDEQVEDEIIMLSFDEICFFLFTCLFKRKVNMINNCQQIHIACFERSIREIEQYYCNIKTESRVKEQLREVSLCKQILQCSNTLLAQHCRKLKNAFGLAFNEQCVANVLKIRGSSEEFWDLHYAECCQALKTQSSDDSSFSPIESQQSEQNGHNGHNEQNEQNRPRTSTLTESVYMFNNGAQFKTELINYIRHGQEGQLQKKQQKKGMPSFSVLSYFRIKNNKLVEYESKLSEQPVSFIDLHEVESCTFDPIKDNEFLVNMKGCKYRFETDSRDEANKWVQALLSESRNPIFPNAMIYDTRKKEAALCLFRDFDGEIPTTATLRQKTFDVQNQTQIFQEKRNRRMQQARQAHQLQKSLKKSQSPKKTQQSRGRNSPNPRRQIKGRKNKPVRRQDEGTCCSRGFF